MPRARNRAASPVPAVEEAEEVIQDDGNALQFDEPLTWRAGKPIAVSELLRRLKTLSRELQSIEQEDADRETLVPKAQELANPQLLGHKDKGVKAWVMLCIVEMFRLLAPNAPYKGGQLRQIFDIFTSMLVPALASPSDPYSQQHLAILTSLTTIKSIVLLTDIPGSDALILQLFANCFDVMSGTVKGGHGEQLPKNVEYHMTNMLCTLIDECTALPTGVVEIVLAQFLRADPDALNRGSKKSEVPASLVSVEVSPAYNMARSICNTCADKMSRVIGVYFSSVLIDANENFTTAKSGKQKGKKRTHDESEDESDDGMLTPPPEHDLQDVDKAHRLLRELWRSSPDVIQSVVPLMEAEVAGENLELRTMAVQTVGDMIAGIGAAGPPAPVMLDPAAYPSQSLENSVLPAQSQNVLFAPAAPHAFSSVYPVAYQSFIGRSRDRMATVRSAWTTAAGRIIATSGGGKGLDADQQSQLLSRLSNMLMDQDERVRIAAIQAVASFDYNAIMQKLGPNGGVTATGSVLSNLVERIKDQKHHVRAAAIELLGRMWGVAAGAIEEGSARVREILGPIPSKILLAFYVNDRELNALVQKALNDSLLPMTYPPIKAKAATNGDSQRVADSQAAVENETLDPDAIRAERILVLVRDLEPKAKQVFFVLQQHQSGRAKYLESYIAACEKIHGSASTEADDDEKSARKRLEKLIPMMVATTPDPVVAAEHLHKFAKHHDRRTWHLLRFCYNPQSEYRKIMNAIKELTKRLEEAPSGVAAVLDTILVVVRTASVLVYNRSHVPAIMDFARTDDKGLGAAAHEVLTEISAKAPQVFKVHVHELCEGLKKQAPSPESPNSVSTVNELKACAGFARQFPEEMPADRDFCQAMVSFAKHGTPPEAAKHAVSVIVASSEKREMYAEDVLQYCLTDFEYGAESFLARLAALSQLRLLASKECEEHSEEIMDISVTKILQGVNAIDEDDDPEWKDDIGDDLCAKLWALRILVNGLRGMDAGSIESKEKSRDVASNVYKLLNTLIEHGGRIGSGDAGPRHHKAHLRLAAAKHLLKLSCNKHIDQYLSTRDFNSLAKVCQDSQTDVRSGFVKTLKKYLGQGKLPTRFYGLVFLYAWEPTRSVKDSVTTWLKSRAALSAKSKDTVMESVFARFLSLLAHHQDFSTEVRDLEDFVEYVIFYLKTVATQQNISLIYHIAQRLKAVQDGIDPDQSEKLYTISDLAESVIRNFVEIHGWSLQVYSGKVRLPTGIFAALSDHALAQEVAGKRYLPEEFDDETIEGLVKASMRSKKRKADGSSSQAAKKAKGTVDGERKKRKVAVAKTPRAQKAVKTSKKKISEVVPSSDRRRSARASNAKNYAESDSDNEEDEGEDGAVDQWQSEAMDVDADKENRATSSTPPTSDPTPAPVALPVREEKAVATKATARKKKAVPAQRSTRATRGKTKEKDILDVPDNSEDEVLSEPPSDMEA